MDWVTLFPFALFRVRNSPYQMGLTPLKIMYGIPRLMIPSLQTDLVFTLEDQNILNSPNRLQLTHQQVWPQL